MLSTNRIGLRELSYGYGLLHIRNQLLITTIGLKFYGYLRILDYLFEKKSCEISSYINLENIMQVNNVCNEVPHLSNGPKGIVKMAPSTSSFSNIGQHIVGSPSWHNYSSRFLIFSFLKHRAPSKQFSRFGTKFKQGQRSMATTSCKRPIGDDAIYGTAVDATYSTAKHLQLGEMLLDIIQIGVIDLLQSREP